jgi:hypothetical protein
MAKTKSKFGTAVFANFALFLPRQPAADKRASRISLSGSGGMAPGRMTSRTMGHKDRPAITAEKGLRRDRSEFPAHRNKTLYLEAARRFFAARLFPDGRALLWGPAFIAIPLMKRSNQQARPF